MEPLSLADTRPRPRREVLPCHHRSTIVFGRVFAAHQLGAAAAAPGTGVVRDVFGTCTYAWFGGAALGVVAAVLSVSLRRPPTEPDPARRDPTTEAETVAELTP